MIASVNPQLRLSPPNPPPPPPPPNQLVSSVRQRQRLLQTQSQPHQPSVARTTLLTLSQLRKSGSTFSDAQ